MCSLSLEDIAIYKADYRLNINCAVASLRSRCGRVRYFEYLGALSPWDITVYNRRPIDGIVNETNKEIIDHQSLFCSPMKSILTLLAIGSSTASALLYQLSTTIPWTQSTPTSVGQSAIYNGTYYLADRTNKGVRVVDLSSNKQIALIESFQGLVTVNDKPNYAKSGPNGLLILPDRKELYVGDGNGTLKVIDLATNSIVANITVNSTERADAMAYDSETGTVICTIPNDTPPRVAVISAKNRTVNGYVAFENASGLQQPAWNSVDKRFYISVPSTKANPGGVVAIIDVNTFNITKILPLPQCIPAGIVFGPNQSLFIGCSQQQILTYNISNSLVMNVTMGNIIANISGVSGVDQVTYDSKAGYYYASAYRNLEGGIRAGIPIPRLAVIDTTTNKSFQNIVSDNVTANSVAVDSATNVLVVPIYKSGLVVYKLANSTANSTSASVPTASSTSSGVNKTTTIHALYYLILTLFAGTMLS